MKYLTSQPLVVAFAVASLLLDLVVLNPETGGQLMMALMFGQTFAIGGWLIVGRGRRLFRGAMFIALTLGLCCLMTLKVAAPGDFRADFGEILAGLAFFAGSAATLTLCCWAPLHWLSKRRGGSVSEAKLQFPISELLGWMIIVAVGSAVMRMAAAFDASARDIVGMLLMSFAAALIMAMFAVDRPRSWASVFIAAGALAALLGVLRWLMPDLDREAMTGIAGSMAYVALWTAVQRLDARWEEARRRKAEYLLQRTSDSSEAAMPERHAA